MSDGVAPLDGTPLNAPVLDSTSFFLPAGTGGKKLSMNVCTGIGPTVQVLASWTSLWLREYALVGSSPLVCGWWSSRAIGVLETGLRLTVKPALSMMRAQVEGLVT